MWHYLMRIVGVVLCLWATTVQAAGFSGKYQGVISNEPMQLVLQQTGSTLTGAMTSHNGDHYEITGTVNGNVAACEGLYNKDGSSWSFLFTITSAGLVWTPTLLGMPVVNAATTFQREGAAKSGSATGKLDQRFIGSWVNTNSYVSGDFSAASEQYVQFHPNGTFVHSSGRVVGGGNNGSFDSGASANTTRGRWQAQDRILYYLADGSNGWEAYGRYSFTEDGRTMMFVFGNGNKELWERQ